MKKRPLITFTDEELVEEFAKCAHRWGEALEMEQTSRAGKMVFRLSDLGDELKSRGPTARLKLAPLLASMDPGIRYYAARNLLALLPERSRDAITSVWQAGRFGISGNAGMTLEFLDSGHFVPS